MNDAEGHHHPGEELLIHFAKAFADYLDCRDGTSLPESIGEIEVAQKETDPVGKIHGEGKCTGFVGFARGTRVSDCADK